MIPFNKNQLLNEKKIQFNLQFFIRKSKIEGYATIYCHISLNQKRTNTPFTTGIKIPIECWDKNQKKIICKGYEEENNELALIKSDIYENFVYLKKADIRVNANSLKNAYLNKEYLHYKISSIKDVMNIHLEKYTNNNKYKKGTKRIIKRHHKKIIEYLGNIEAENLKEYHIDNFFVHLVKVHNNKHNTAVRVIEFLKAGLKNAHEKGHLSFYPCNDYSIHRVKTAKKAYLSKTEIKKIIELELFSKRMDKIKDVFIFMCHTGLDYSSYQLFSKEWIKEKNGIEYVDYSRSKTVENGLFPFLKKTKEIAKKYNYKLPFIQNHHFNSFIKQICYMAGIDEKKCGKISTHSARVTAGMIWLNEGIRIEVVSRMLGHASIETTQRYYAEIELDTVLKETRILI